MTVRAIFVMLALLMCCEVSHGKEERWSNFAEDSDLKYYLDQKSVVALPDNVYIFWVRSVAKDKDYFKKEYNLSNLSYIFTNYELDCAVSSYRIRGTIMFDQTRREISKALPDAGEPVFEPVPPESMLELVQDEICVSEDVSEEGAAKGPEAEQQRTAARVEQVAPVEQVEQVIPVEPPFDTVTPSEAENLAPPTL